VIAPTVNTELMSAHLRMIADEPTAMYTWCWCWTARVWAWMRQHDLSNRAFKDEADTAQACAESWNKLTPERLRSITATQWLTHEK